MKRLFQQDILTTSIKNRLLGNVVQKSQVFAAIASLAPGDFVEATITTTSNIGARTIVIPDITVYQDTLDPDNQIPAGLNVAQGTFNLIGPWNDYRTTDDINTKTKLFIQNITADTPGTYGGIVGSNVNNGSVSESSGAYQNSLSRISVGHSAAAGNIPLAVRFTAVTIPQGATINLAEVVLTGKTDNFVAVDVIFKGINEDNTASFATSPFARPTTTANLALTIFNVFADDPHGFDVTSIVQEIIDRAGWVSGNALGIFCFNNGTTGDNWDEWWSFSGSPAKAATLAIDYTVAGETHSVIIVEQSRSMMGGGNIHA